FLLPDALQLDLSMTPAAQFRPAGPRFRLLFGETAGGESESATQPVAGDLFLSTPSIAGDIFGWGVIYALHARACIERGRVWQAFTDALSFRGPRWSPPQSLLPSSHEVRGSSPETRRRDRRPTGETSAAAIRRRRPRLKSRTLGVRSSHPTQPATCPRRDSA